MIRETGEWDIRLTNPLINFFPERKGYWFKVSRKQARKLVRILAKAYKVKAPKVDDTSPVTAQGVRHNGWYRPAIRTISVWGRAHVKTVMHEFYHHLDEVTGGKYDSSDWPDHRLTFHNERTTPASYAWQFAEKLFNLLRAYRPGALGKEAMAKKDKQKTNPAVEHGKKMTAAEQKSVKAQLAQLIAGSSPAAKGEKPDARKPSELAPVATAILGKKGKGAAAAPPPPEGKKTKGSAVNDFVKANAKKKIHLLVKGNPHREGTKAYTTFALFKEGMTVEAAKDSCDTHGGDFGYLQGSIRRKSIELK